MKDFCKNFRMAFERKAGYNVAVTSKEQLIDRK